MGRGSFPGWLGGVEVAGESLVMLEGCIVGVFWGIISLTSKLSCDFIIWFCFSDMYFSVW